MKCPICNRLADKWNENYYYCHDHLYRLAIYDGNGTSNLNTISFLFKDKLRIYYNLFDNLLMIGDSNTTMHMEFLEFKKMIKSKDFSKLEKYLLMI